MGVSSVCEMAACEHPPVGVQRDHGFWSSDGGNCSESERKSPSSGSVSPVGLAHFCDEDSQVQTASTDWAQLEKGKVNLLAVSSHEEPPNEPHFEKQSLKSESERSKSAERSRRGFHTQTMAARATPSTDIAIVSQLEPAPQLLAVLETVLSELSSSNEEKPAQLQVNTLQGELATFKESASRQDDLDAQGKTAQLEPDANTSSRRRSGTVETWPTRKEKSTDDKQQHPPSFGWGHKQAQGHSSQFSSFSWGEKAEAGGGIQSSWLEPLKDGRATGPKRKHAASSWLPHASNQAATGNLLILPDQQHQRQQPAPSSAHTKLAKEAAKQKLEELRELRASGSIDEKEYRRRKQQLKDARLRTLSAATPAVGGSNTDTGRFAFKRRRRQACMDITTIDWTVKQACVQ